MSKDIISVSERTSCQCEELARCTCQPYDELVFKVNGKAGFGGGDLVMDPKTEEQFFACRFMGRDFRARNATDAKEQLRVHFTGFQHIQIV